MRGYHLSINLGNIDKTFFKSRFFVVNLAQMAFTSMGIPCLANLRCESPVVPDLRQTTGSSSDFISKTYSTSLFQQNNTLLRVMILTYFLTYHVEFSMA